MMTAGAAYTTTLTRITATGGISNTGAVKNIGGKDSVCQQRRSDLDHFQIFSQCHLPKKVHVPQLSEVRPLDLLATTLTVNCNCGISTGF